MQEVGKGACFRDRLLKNVGTLDEQWIVFMRARTEHINGNLHAGQILAQAVMKFTGNTPAFLVLNIEKPAAQFAQRFFGLSPCGSIDCGNADLSHVAAAFSNWEIIHQPMAVASRTMDRDLTIENRLSRVEDLSQERFATDTWFAKSFEYRFADETVGGPACHSRQHVIHSGKAEAGIQNAKTDS